MRSNKIYSLVFITTLFISGWSNVKAEIFKGFPDMIICKPGQAMNTPGELVFYVEGRSKNGTALYKSIGRQTLALKIGKDGVVKAETTTVNDCIDQSLKQLRKQGRTLNFTK